tara:strand:- start:2739 stop:2888 length:150 start_codon:yes stop_codon:yes gene_type:complete
MFLTEEGPEGPSLGSVKELYPTTIWSTQNNTNSIAKLRPKNKPLNFSGL